MKNISELRQDLVTGDWVVVATSRARRPNEYARERAKEHPQPKSSCPFERLIPSALVVYDRKGERFRVTPKDRGYLEKHWWLQVVPNKYPAFGQGACQIVRTVGPYRWQDGVGFHEVVITRDHQRSIAAMNLKEAEMVLRAYRHRYLGLKDEGCVEFVSIFHNHGREAGATISHPHSQIIATPVIPPDVKRSLHGSREYFRKYRRCVHCTIIRQERREGWRIVHQNRGFVAFCPFASRQAFELRIFPLRHNPEFETISDAEIELAADALRTALAKLSSTLANPAYNFFIHTAPTADGSQAPHYHWHIEIVPKTAIWAGFEIGTGIEISTISPEAAAAFLRKARVS
ncbi:MAG: DUF4921 family protein [Candidatus Sungbacteria bacterium]|uniref:DUF4921 family protein n=1 Tax=Candidatus Sungiibacteriota bacterium TaxID=2750080 RepID=A0A932YX94_9BACT|nr:DUF4921 family protein [Candidatus Sungbacteria bacterium]